MEEALRSLLMGTAAIKAIVAARIDWGLRAQGATLPAIDLHQVSGVPSMTMSGAADWSRDRIQLDCWGRTYKAARDLADLIGAKPEAGQPGGLLVGFRGTVGAVQLRTFILDRRSDTDADNVGPLFRTSLDLQVWHNP